MVYIDVKLSPHQQEIKVLTGSGENQSLLFYRGVASFGLNKLLNGILYRLPLTPVSKLKQHGTDGILTSICTNKTCTS